MINKILVVEDSSSWRKFHLTALHSIFSSNFNITMASSAKEGYDAVLQNINEPFDLIITDLQMEFDFEPDLAGEWLVKQIKTHKEYSNTKIIIISAMFNITTIARKSDVEFIRKSDLARDVSCLRNLINKYK